MNNDDKKKGSEAYQEIMDDLFSAGPGSGQHPLTQFVISTSRDLLDERDIDTRKAQINAVYDSLNQDGRTLTREEFFDLVEGYRRHLASRQITDDSNARPAGQPKLETADDSSIEEVTKSLSELDFTPLFLSRDYFSAIKEKTFTGLLDDIEDNAEALENVDALENADALDNVDPLDNVDALENADALDNVDPFAKFFRELIVQEFVDHLRITGQHLDQNDTRTMQYKELIEDLREAQRSGVISPSNLGNEGHLIKRVTTQGPPPVLRKRKYESSGEGWQRQTREGPFLKDPKLDDDLALKILLEFEGLAEFQVKGDAGGSTGAGNAPSSSLPILRARTPELDARRVRPRTVGSTGAGNARPSLNGAAGGSTEAGNEPDDSLGFGGSAFSSPPRRVRQRTVGNDGFGTPEPEVRSVRPRTGGAAGAGNTGDSLGFGGSGSAFTSLLGNENLTPPSTPPSTPRMARRSSSKGKEPLSPSKISDNHSRSPGR